MENEVKVDFQIGIDYENIKGKTIPQTPEEIDDFISSVISVTVLDVHINETPMPEISEVPHYDYDLENGATVSIYGGR